MGVSERREREREGGREGGREREKGRERERSVQTAEFNGLTSVGMNGGSTSFLSSSSQVHSHTVLRKELVRRLAALAGKKRLEQDPVDTHSDHYC